MNLAHLARVVEHQQTQDGEPEDLAPLLEESARQARIARAREAYTAAMSKVLTLEPGDTREAVRVYAEALGAAQGLIAALEG